MTKRVIFVGAGHTHLSVIKEWKKKKKDVEWILISPGQYQYYSGMYSGYMEGRYAIEDIRVPLRSFCNENGGTFVSAKVTSIDPEQNIVLTNAGKVMHFDYLSVDIGAQPKGLEIPHVQKHAEVLKANENFSEAVESVRTSHHPLIVGGGYAGVEMAFTAQAWRSRNKFQSPVKIISGSKVLPEDTEEARQQVYDLLDKRGIEYFENEEVHRVTDRTVETDSLSFPYEDLLWMTGPKAPAWFEASRLPVDSEGYLLVNEHLQSVAYPQIFGVGDCVTIAGHEDIPKNGISAVKEAPVLLENIKRSLKGKKLAKYSPQKNYMAILNLGRKQGLMIYGDKTRTGKAPFKIKHRIDKKFIKELQPSRKA